MLLQISLSIDGHTTYDRFFETFLTDRFTGSRFLKGVQRSLRP